MIPIDIEQLKKRYLLANTADQIYKWFRENSSLPDLAREEYKEVLVKEFAKITEKEERTIDDVVVAYAILAIITFYEYGEGKKLLGKLNLSKLKWGEELKNIYKREARVTSFATEHGRGIVTDYKGTRQENSSAVSYMSMRNNKSMKRR
jgi:hypothetical protein